MILFVKALDSCSPLRTCGDKLRRNDTINMSLQALGRGSKNFT